MKIENEKIKLTAFDPARLGALKPDQAEMLQLLQQNLSIFEVVQHFFAKGRLISFLSLLGLVQQLLAEKLILNPVFYKYFVPEDTVAVRPETALVEKPAAGGVSPELVKNVPFLRSLNPELLNVFLQHSSVMNVPEGVVFCQEGAAQRSLLVLLSGQASVYKRNPDGSRRKLVVLNEDSLFGEAGFFFGTPRAATIVADTACQVLIIKYIPELYDGAIKTEKARELQWRIWTVHALLKSELFSDLPQECFDALIFAGELKSFAPQTVFTRQGDPGDTCYVIVQGSMNVHKDQKQVNTMTQGDCFGELALMVSGGKRMATVTAATEGIVLEIQRANFYRLLARNLLLACAFENIARQRVGGKK